MKFYAIHKYARITPRKARYVIDMIRGKSVNSALEILTNVPKRASYFVKKVLSSAVANAKQKENVKLNNLVVQEARVHGGPTLKRFRPGPMGRAMRILKRTSHIEITIVENKAAETKDKRGE